MVPAVRRAGARLIQQERTNCEYKVGAGGSRPAGPVLPPCPLIPFSHHTRSKHTRTHAHTLAGHDVPTGVSRRRRAILVQEFLPVDVTQALEEGQGAECVGVSNLHIARHSLDHTHEALQF